MNRTFYSQDQELSFHASAEVPLGGVVVDDGVTNSDDNKTVFLSVRATQSLGERPIYVSVSQATSTYGTCVLPVSSPVYVAYNTTDGTPAKGEVWGPVASTMTIRKGFPGFKCLAAGDAGLVLAVYDAQSEPSYLAKLDGALNANSSATGSIYKWTGSAWADTNVNATVYAPRALGSSSISSGKFVRAKWTAQSRRLEVPGAAEC